MKDRILELREQGKTYNEIQKTLGCSKGTISYHCGQGQKAKTAERQRKNRAKDHPYKKKVERFCWVRPVATNRTATSSVKKRLYEKVRTFHMEYTNMEYKYTTPEFTFEDVIAKFGENPTCYLTGEPIDIYKPSSYQFDHIIPRSRGGDNSLDNLGICSNAANLAKRDMTHDEFVHFCKRVVETHSGK